MITICGVAVRTPHVTVPDDPIPSAAPAYSHAEPLQPQLRSDPWCDPARIVDRKQAWQPSACGSFVPRRNPCILAGWNFACPSARDVWGMACLCSAYAGPTLHNLCNHSFARTARPWGQGVAGMACR